MSTTPRNDLMVSELLNRLASLEENWWIERRRRRRLELVGVLLLLGVLVLGALGKVLGIAAFDAGQAVAQRMHPELAHHVLMAMTAVTTVAAFEAVGSIIALLLAFRTGQAYDRLWEGRQLWDGAPPSALCADVGQ